MGLYYEFLVVRMIKYFCNFIVVSFFLGFYQFNSFEYFICHQQFILFLDN